MQTFNFSEHYQTLTDTELLEILDKPDNYQPQAVEAAKEEISRRQLTPEAIAQARKPLIEKQQQRQAKKEKTDAAVRKFADTINPVKSAELPVEKTIRMIAIVFTLYFIWLAIKSYDTWLYTMLYLMENPFISIIETGIVALLTIGLILFWLKRKTGWIMLVAYWVVCVTFGIYELYKSLFGPDQELFLVPPVPSEIRFLYVLVIAIVLFGLCRPKIREYFSVSNKKMIEMLLFQIAISGVLLFIIEWS